MGKNLVPGNVFKFLELAVGHGCVNCLKVPVLVVIGLASWSSEWLVDHLLFDHGQILSVFCEAFVWVAAYLFIALFS